jgi:hypothetical protein
MLGPLWKTSPDDTPLDRSDPGMFLDAFILPCESQSTLVSPCRQASCNRRSAVTMWVGRHVLPERENGWNVAQPWLRTIWRAPTSIKPPVIRRQTRNRSSSQGSVLDIRLGSRAHRQTGSALLLPCGLRTEALHERYRGPGPWRDFAEADGRSRPGSTGTAPSARIKRCAIEARWSGAVNNSSRWLDVEGALQPALADLSAA